MNWTSNVGVTDFKNGPVLLIHPMYLFHYHHGRIGKQYKNRQQNKLQN